MPKISLTSLDSISFAVRALLVCQDYIAVQLALASQLRARGLSPYQSTVEHLAYCAST